MNDAIHIRPAELHDLEAIFEAVCESHPELSRWMAWCHPAYDRQDVRTWLQTVERGRTDGTEYGYVIEDSTGGYLGTCGLNRIDKFSGVANLGYWVRSSAAGRGIATAAVLKLRDVAFQELALHRLEILAAVDNHASQRVAEKAGAIREAILRDRFLLNGRRHDAVLFAIVNSA